MVAGKRNYIIALTVDKATIRCEGRLFAGSLTTNSALMINAIEYLFYRVTEHRFAGTVLRPLKITEARIGDRIHDIVQFARFKLAGVVVCVTVPTYFQTQAQAIVLVVVDIVIDLVTIHDIEVRVLVITVVHLAFLQEIGGTAVERFHLLEMALVLEGLFPCLVIVLVLHVQRHQMDVVLAVGGQIDLHFLRQIVVTGG